MHKRIVDVQYVAARIGVKALILWIQASFQHSSRQTGIIKFLKRSLKRSYSCCHHNLTAFLGGELWRNVAQNIKPHNVSVLKLTMIIHNLRKRKISRRNCPPQEAITARYVVRREAQHLSPLHWRPFLAAINKHYQRRLLFAVLLCIPFSKASVSLVQGWEDSCTRCGLQCKKKKCMRQKKNHLVFTIVLLGNHI